MLLIRGICKCYIGSNVACQIKVWVSYREFVYDHAHVPEVGKFAPATLTAKFHTSCHIIGQRSL